jgi:two-component system cell cycle response regulator CpdR
MARILIAEHNATVTSYLTAALKKAGHVIEIVDNSLDAWRAISRAHFDVMLIDVIMPGVDGFVLAQRALQENPLTQIVFVTGFAAVAMDTYATPSYAPAPMTTRPFHLKDINARLRALLGGAFPAGEAAGNDDPGVVIYADFQKKAEVREVAQH